ILTTQKLHYIYGKTPDKDVLIKFVGDRLGLQIPSEAIDGVWRFRTSSALSSNRSPIIGVSFNDLCVRSSILSKASVLKKSSDASVRSVFIGKHLTKLQSQSTYEKYQQRKTQQNNHQQ
ncbi:unnamed protein product, partial [Didymodactylos carnosus]